VASNGTHLAILDGNGSPLLRVPRFSVAAPGSLEKLAAVLRSLAMFQVVRFLTTYQVHSPLPSEWFSVRLFNKASRAHDGSGGLQVYHGDVLTYAISNRTDSLPTYVHMLSLNASWSITTLLWNIRIPPRQQRTGELTMTIPSKINDDDPLEVEDTILVIFCVGKQSGETLVTSSEWLKSVYMPPVLLKHGSETHEVPVWPFFVPPPNWVVKHFTVRTVQRPNGDVGGLNGA
jgi:hypothetical protein